MRDCGLFGLKSRNLNYIKSWSCHSVILGDPTDIENTSCTRYMSFNRRTAAQVVRTSEQEDARQCWSSTIM